MKCLPLLIATTIAAAASASPAPRAGTPKADDDRADQVVCHREADTGSIIQRKICKTRAQWAAEREEAQRQGQTLFERGAISSCGSTVPGGCD